MCSYFFRFIVSLQMKKQLKTKYMMDTTKKLMTLLLVLLGMTQAVAQEYEYVPFVREGVKWVCYYDNPINATDPEGSFIPSGQHYYTLELKGDTVINGRSYKPLHFYSGKSINEENDTIPVYLREENKIVYGIIPDDTRYYECPIGIGTMVLSTNICATNIETGVEFTLYDFNDLETFYDSNAAEALDSSWPLLKRDCNISTDTVLIGDQLRKRLVIHSPYSWDEYIIEGIGYARNGLPGNPFNYFYNITTGVDQVIYNLCHVIENNKIVYRALWCEDLEPEPNGYEYIPFVREGVKWVYSIQDYRYEEDYETNPARGDNKFYRTLEIRGDTVINGKAYKAMHMCVDDQYSEPKDVVPLYLREEDKMVYGIVPNGKYYDDAKLGFFAWDEVIYSGEEFLLYDFQDPITYWDNLVNDDWYSIQFQLDTIKVGGHYAKRLFDSRQEGYYFQVIEGIGAMGMNSYPLAFFMPACTGIHCTEYYNLEKVIENGEVIYPQDYVEDRYLPLIREGVSWVYERVTVNNGDTTSNYYTYEFKGNHPELDSFNRVFKAVYSKNYDASSASYGDERLVAGLREDESLVMCHRNEVLNSVLEQDRNLIDFYTFQYSDGTKLLYGFSTVESGMYTMDYFMDQQREPFLNGENFIMLDPIMIDGHMCSRCAYLDENGDPLAYIIEGIGFDSRVMGDLLTPFTRKPDPNADYQEWCGLSHVIKDGKIIYKGMRYSLNVPGDVNGDGEVNIGDINTVIDVVIMGGNAGHNHTPGDGSIDGDVNGDGEVNIGDINAIIEMILNNY